MRVRPQRPAERRRRGLRRRNAAADGRAAATSEPAQPAPPPAGGAPDGVAAESETFESHVEERRHRASVTPEDHALYRCQCGYQFEASVSASVACPHCGSGQAW
ncbi:MAG TPA: hypothetical protein VFT50_08805 [Baekduia sp.]|nr:hypothetical protein [Baekduia sp.]